MSSRNLLMAPKHKQLTKRKRGSEIKKRNSSHQLRRSTSTNETSNTTLH